MPYCRLVEELASGSLSSILLLDPKNQTSFGTAQPPSLPITYTQAIDGSAIGPSVGFVRGLPLTRAEPVIVSDIATDPLWARLSRSSPLGHGLRACWSTPIISSAGKVFGDLRYLLSRTAQPHSSGA